MYERERFGLARHQRSWITITLVVMDFSEERRADRFINQSLTHWIDEAYEFKRLFSVRVL